MSSDSDVEQNYEYQPRGKVSGAITNIPEADCRVCGHSISQPVPTGIWLHTGFNDEDYQDRFYTEFPEHTPIPATLIESLLIQNYYEDRDYGNGQCQLHRKYWLQQTKLKKKEIDGMIGSDRYDKWNYWRNQYERFNSLIIEKFVKSKKLTRTRNFPLPKIMIVYNFRGKILKEFEISMSSDNIIHSWFVPEIVLVGKKKYVVRSDPRFTKKSTKRSEYCFILKELGKYDKEYLKKYGEGTVRQLDSYFEKHVVKEEDSKK